MPDSNGNCACVRMRMQFPAQHWPHCKLNPANIRRDDPKLYAKLSETFTPSELVAVETSGQL